MNAEAAVTINDVMRVAEDRGGRDEKLSALLQTWRGCEPSPGFNEQVWRRIRATTNRAEGTIGAEWLLAWIRPHPVWLGAIAASAAVVVGAMAGLATRLEPNGHHDAEALLHAQTLAGSYLEVVSGEFR